jgi:hypothetical protein
MSTLDEMLSNLFEEDTKIKSAILNGLPFPSVTVIEKDTAYYLKIYRDYIHYTLIENKKRKRAKLPEYEILNFSEWRKQNETN